ncbi:MAG TPA: hypothetical protein VGR73_21035 [Bryobacteraceae bacterium]|nr:hypothetical protein [Bryobacteraceae bacterium]
MDWESNLAVLVPFALVALVFYIGHRLSKPKRNKRRVGYEREEIHINAEEVPEFKPTWRNTR